MAKKETLPKVTAFIRCVFIDIFILLYDEFVDFLEEFVCVICVSVELDRL